MIRAIVRRLDSQTLRSARTHHKQRFACFRCSGELERQAFPMNRDAIAEIGVDDKGRLYVTPKTKSFPHIYREAMEVHWDSEGKYLCSPTPPRSQLATPIWWFKQILSAAKEQECELVLETATRWNNVPQNVKDEIVSFQGSVDA